jgi:hypothetical protein
MGVAGQKLKAGIIRWTPRDYMTVCCGMVPLLDGGVKQQQAMEQAQRLLPPKRQRDPVSLPSNLVQPLYRSTLAKVRAMSPDDRATMTASVTAEQGGQAEAPLSGPIDSPIDGRSKGVRWSARELALIARRVAYLQRELQDKRVLSRLIKVAQDIELSPERRRSSASIDVAMAALRVELPKAYAQSRVLLADQPFDPRATEHTALPEPEPEPEPEQAPEAPQAPKPVSAPAPAAQAAQPPSDAVKAFGELFARGMSELVQSVAGQVLADLEGRVSAMSERLVRSAIEVLGAGVPGIVHQALEKELGATGAPPAAPLALLALPQGAANPKPVHLDVVGLIGHQIAEVKTQLNGHAAGIRFIDAEKVNSWTPRAKVILNTKFISHSAERKCIKAGIKPVRVQGGASAIVAAVRAICEAEGITLPH